MRQGAHVVFLVLGMFACAAGCGGEETSFDGQSLAFPDDFPLDTVKDLDAGDQGGVADWYEISGLSAGTTYTLSLTLSPNEGDDLHVTAVRDAHDFGPENEYCTGLGRAEDAGPSCSFSADDSTVYVYVTPGFVEQDAEEVGYRLGLTAN